MRKSKRVRSSVPEFAVGDQIDVDPEYIANHPERDCSGQARIAEVSDMLGSPVYGVTFPNMLAGFKFYWISASDLRPTSSGTPAS